MKTQPSPHTHNRTAPVGVLLANLGTPDVPTTGAVGRYLREFLSDRRVVDIPRLAWWFVLYCIVLPLRSPKSARAYQKIWDNVRNDSPLRLHTADLATAVQARFNQTHPLAVKVAWGMRYGTPGITKAVAALKAAGCEKIIFMPLYPQYAGATTASACEAFFDALKQHRFMPAVRVAGPFHDHPAYTEALAHTVTEHLKGQAWQPELLLASYHGIPKATFDKGDPYPCMCWKTSRLLKKALGLEAGMLESTFQSRLGRAEWMTPYTDKTLAALPGRGIKNVVVLAPSFFSDCLETLEELNIAGRKTFMAAGGDNFSYVPALNASPAATKAACTILHENMAGWLPE